MFIIRDGTRIQNCCHITHARPYKIPQELIDGLARSYTGLQELIDCFPVRTEGFRNWSTDSTLFVGTYRHYTPAITRNCSPNRVCLKGGAAAPPHSLLLGFYLLGFRPLRITVFTDVPYPDVIGRFLFQLQSDLSE